MDLNSLPSPSPDSQFNLFIDCEMIGVAFLLLMATVDSQEHKVLIDATIWERLFPLLAHQHPARNEGDSKKIISCVEDRLLFTFRMT